MMPALGLVVDTYTSIGSATGNEIGRRARSRAELFMLEDHKASLLFAAPFNERIDLEGLGYRRGYRDAMVEVMSWVTGRDTDEILVELHDEIAGPAGPCPRTGPVEPGPNTWERGTVKWELP